MQPPLNEVYAYHEAGHQVAAWSLGRLLQSVCITDDGGKSLDGHRPRLDLEDADAEALILWAGECAERELHDHLQHEEDDYASASDIRKIEHWASRLFPDDPRSANDWMLRTRLLSQEIIRKHWLKVRAVAEVLKVQRILTGDEVLGLIERRDSG